MERADQRELSAMTPVSRRWRFWLLAACALALAVAVFNELDGTPGLPWAGKPGFDWSNTPKPYTIAITSVE